MKYEDGPDLSYGLYVVLIFDSRGSKEYGDSSQVEMICLLHTWTCLCGKAYA